MSTRPWWYIAVWVVLAGVIVGTAPALQTTSDQSEFLPGHYESIRAANAQADHFTQASSPGAIVVFERPDGAALSAADQAKATEIAEKLAPQLKTTTFQQAVVTQNASGAPNVSADGKVMVGVIPLAEDTSGYETQNMSDGADLRTSLASLSHDSGLTVQTTGAVPQGVDSQESGEKALAIVGIATIVLIVGLLALIFRSVIICLMPVVVVGLISAVATGLIGIANEVFNLKADASIQQILVVVLYGIGTDYILFFLFRYRERLRQGAQTKEAVAWGLHRAGEAITSAGGAVIAAFMALLLSSLGIFRAIGPALAIAVFVTMVAVLTLVPAVVTVLGKHLFWPNKSWHREPEAARFAAIGRGMAKRPAAYAAAAGLVMVALATFALGFKPSFDFTSSVPKDLESSKAMVTFTEHFAAGEADPTPVLLVGKDGSAVTEASLPGFQKALEGARGVATVHPGQLSKDGKAAQFMVILDHDPASDIAREDVSGPIRDAAHAAAPSGTEAFVGGTASVFADMQTAMNRDYSVVFPVAAVIILLILAALLRSVVAPWYLMAAVGLGFAATLGATVIVFQHLKGDGGLIFMLPIYIYLFVTALGTDYNILMVARLREEAQAGKSPREAAAEAVKHAGPTIAAAGVILAGTFASLMLAGNSLMMSMGFAISFGIIIAAFVMALFFTPALTALIGHAAWWPGHGDEKKPEETLPVGPRSVEAGGAPQA